VRKANPAKVRVKLPPIESYEKELEFSAEGPGRVVVRLERLMGTDRVRILDAKYMRTLLERLEGEEKKSWTKRTRQRKNDEKNRYRQLAIEGHMEPDADMQDLYNHPVFRVNRILNRLAKLDMDMGATVTLKLPPMTPCEPLVDGDENGEIFKTYPGHRPVQKSKKEEAKKDEEKPEEEESPYQRYQKEHNLPERPLPEEEEEEDEDWGDEDHPQRRKKSGPKTADSDDTRERSSLDNVKRLYGVADDEDLESIWQPYHSGLVDLLYMDESEQSWAMYEISKAILGVYKRENLVADDFVSKSFKIRQ